MALFDEDAEKRQKISMEKKLEEWRDILMPFMLLIWQKRKTWMIYNGAALVLILLYLFFLAKPYFTVSVDILPDYGSKSSSLEGGGLSDLAAMAGLNIEAIAPTDIYEDLIQSESVLGPALLSKYLTKEYKDSVNLVDYFDIQPMSNVPPNLRERSRFLELFDMFGKGGMLKSGVDRQTKILTLSITMPESKLAADVANRIVNSLDRYIRTQRKSFATNQRMYLEKRVKEISDTLAIAEDRLRSFKEKNIMGGPIPRLVLEESRLGRSVELQQTVYADLSRQLELVKLDEFKDAPVLNIKEFAGDPLIKDGPRRARMFILFMFFSVVASSMFFAYEPKLKKAWALIWNIRHYFR